MEKDGTVTVTVTLTGGSTVRVAVDATERVTLAVSLTICVAVCVTVILSVEGIRRVVVGLTVATETVEMYSVLKMETVGTVEAKKVTGVATGMTATVSKVKKFVNVER